MSKKYNDNELFGLSISKVAYSIKGRGEEIIGILRYESVGKIPNFHIVPFEEIEQYDKYIKEGKEDDIKKYLNIIYFKVKDFESYRLLDEKAVS